MKRVTTEERLKTEVLTTDQILRWPDEAQKKLTTELRTMFREAFPKTSEEDINRCVGYAFKRPGGKFHRQITFLRDISSRIEELLSKCSRLIAIIIIDRGEIEYGNRVIHGIYVLLRVVVPEYQGSGVGNVLITNIVKEWQPDVLLTTCAQSATLHSWVRLPQKGEITGFEVYPRLDRVNGKDHVITVPYRAIEFVITAFKQFYFGVVDGKSELVDKAIGNLTVHMVRKEIYGEMYNFHPWKKHGREDTLANALGVTDKDGILIVLRKNNLVFKDFEVDRGYP
jgi:hypothetical protein